MNIRKMSICMLVLCIFSAATGCESDDNSSNNGAKTDKNTGASIGGGAGNMVDGDAGDDGAGSMGMDSDPSGGAGDGDGSGSGGGAGTDGTAGTPEAGTPEAGTPEAGTMEPDPEVDMEPTVENVPPMVTLLSSPEVAAPTGQAIALSVSVIDDGIPEPAALTSSWSVVEGPGEPTFTDSAAPSTEVTFSVAGDYTLELNVSDGELTGTVRVFFQIVAADRPLQIALLTSNLDAADNSPGVDNALIQYLESQGHTVTTFSPATGPAAVGERDVVLFSSGMDSSAVDTGWASAPMPVLIWEFYALGRLAMTDNVAGTNVHDFNGGNQINVTGSGPLAAGLSGLVQVSEAGTGTLVAPTSLPGTAKVVATLAGAQGAMHFGRPVYFYYETGDTMFQGAIAPARRVAIPLGLNQARTLTADGQAILTAALTWAVNGSVLDVPEVDPVTEGALKIMPIGDSITRGTGGNNSYRQFLAAQLDDAGCAYDFVGSLTNNDKGPPTVVFDWDHEGHGGWTTGDMLMSIDGFAGPRNPDIALIHLGTNDVLTGEAAGAETNLSGIIDSLRAINPSVEIILAKIIPGSAERVVSGMPVSLPTGVPAMNDVIQKVADDKGTAIVDMTGGYDEATMNLADGIHPNATGEAFMATKWYGALMPMLSCGN